MIGSEFGSIFEEELQDILKRIIFIPYADPDFKTGTTQDQEINFLEMIQHYYTVKLMEKAFEKTKNDEQRNAILNNIKVAMKNTQEVETSPFKHFLNYLAENHEVRF